MQYFLKIKVNAKKTHDEQNIKILNKPFFFPIWLSSNMARHSTILLSLSRTGYVMCEAPPSKIIPDFK